MADKKKDFKISIARSICLSSTEWQMAEFLQGDWSRSEFFRKLVRDAFRKERDKLKNAEKNGY